MISRRPIELGRGHPIGEGSFAFIPHRFLRDGFLASPDPDQRGLSLFLVLAADRDGISSVLVITFDDDIATGNALIDMDRGAFGSRRFQVLPRYAMVSASSGSLEAPAWSSPPSPMAGHRQSPYRSVRRPGRCLTSTTFPHRVASPRNVTGGSCRSLRPLIHFTRPTTVCSKICSSPVLAPTLAASAPGGRMRSIGFLPRPTGAPAPSTIVVRQSRPLRQVTMLTGGTKVDLIGDEEEAACLLDPHRKIPRYQLRATGKSRRSAP